MRMKWITICALAAMIGWNYSGLNQAPISQAAETEAAAKDKSKKDSSLKDEKKKKKKEKRPAVEVVFVLDTTGSMSGLIHAAKEKIWSIANTMATAKPAPDIKIGLVGYRDRNDQYVTTREQMSTDIDAVYTELMKFKADGGGDTPESVNQALHEAVTKFQWDSARSTYKVIFLVGDAPPHMDYQDDVKYQESCQLACKAGIVINTIQCGNLNGTEAIWRDIAKKAEGQYFRVEQSGGAVLEATPFDKELADLSSQINETRVYFGVAKDRERKQAELEEADATQKKASAAANARRAEYYTNAAGKTSILGANELVEALKNKKITIKEIPKAQLPAALQDLDESELKAVIEKKSAKRDALEEKIKELSKKRQAFLQKKADEKAAAGEAPGLDDVIYDSIKEQAAEAGLKYEGGPKR
jgi:Mg-chelatase subunit ChlD